MSRVDPRNVDPRNTVALIGRLSGVRAVTLPSGDELVSFRVIVDRPPRYRGPSGRVRVDAVECTAWRADVRRRAQSLREGTLVTVTGALRRRFWRVGATPASRIDVEVTSLRRAEDEVGAVSR
jgi:single-strand DNA-binding protein